MALSNTATPRYYGEFRERVLRGEIPVNIQVSQQMNRIDAMIADPRYYYDDLAIEGFIRYCEGELTLTDGNDLHLLDTFKLWAEDLLSWFEFVERSVYVPDKDHHGGRYVRKMIKKRVRLKQYLIVARGGAKSMYAYCIQSYFLNVDTDTTHQITTAPTMKQADEVMSPFRTAITRARGPLFKFLTEGSMQNTTGNRALRVKLASTKKGIENFLTGSLLEVRPMSVNKLQGLRPKVSTIDEWLSGDVREDVVGAIEQGASKLDDYIIVAISSEGTVRNGSGDTIKMELTDILKGDYPAPQVSIWWYRLDSIEEVSNTAM
jgi:phage terminase large subunit-like protein